MPGIERREFDAVVVDARIRPPLPYEDQIRGCNLDKVVFVCCGFEERATAIVDALDGVFVSAFGVIVYSTNDEDNRASVNRLRSVNAGCRFEIPASREMTEAVAEVASSVQNPRRTLVIVDISAAASYVIYPLLAAVFDQFPLAQICIFYAEAERYFPTRTHWEEFYSTIIDANDFDTIAEAYAAHEGFESKGVSDYYGSALFPGRTDETSPIHVVAFPNFSLDRTQAMVDLIDTQYGSVEDMTWFVGVPPNESLNGWRCDAVSNLYRPLHRGKVFPVSTLDYQECLRALEQVWSQKGQGSQIVIATVGSKMQHVAAFLHLQMHPDVALVLSEPTRFHSSKYSDGVGARWWLPLGRASRLLHRLKSAGDLRFRW